VSADVTVPAAPEDTTPITGYPDGSWINFASWSPDGLHITFTTRSPGQVRSGRGGILLVLLGVLGGGGGRAGCLKQGALNLTVWPPVAASHFLGF
jgi:hypothetical protein